VFLRSVLQLPVTANVVPSSPILVTLLVEAIISSETSVLTRTTLRNIPEDRILHSQCQVFKFIIGAGVESSPLLLPAFIGLLCQPWMLDGDDCGTVSGMNRFF
jgi:hypothetical protein